MKRFNKYLNVKRDSARAIRRKTDRKMKCAILGGNVHGANNAFEIIQKELIKLGWAYWSQFLNIVDLGNDFSVEMLPGMKLFNEKFNIMVIPHNSGLEISRLEVWEEFQGKGYGGRILESLLHFFIKKGIKDIYILPGQAGIGKSQKSLAYNQLALEKFYEKRGFIRKPGARYWKLDVSMFIKCCIYHEADDSLLNNDTINLVA